LLLLGGGPLETAYRKIAVEEKIVDQIVWHGRLPFAEFMGQISTGNVALYPSRTASDGDSEGGAPVTLIEAQWLGVPSIVSDHDDLPFVAASDGSIVLAASNQTQWAEALEALYRDRSKLERMGMASHDFVHSRHSPQANAQAREHIYDVV
jgi:colanic acid/amylovoran biosynthesis glycosyltransferase